MVAKRRAGVRLKVVHLLAVEFPDLLLEILDALEFRLHERIGIGVGRAQLGQLVARRLELQVHRALVADLVG